MSNFTPLGQSDEWKNLITHQAKMSQQGISTLFENDHDRFNKFSLNAAGIFLDYSKHLITDESLNLLVDLAEKAELPAAIKAMFTGEQLNNTEQRAVLHVALRSPKSDSEEEKAVHQTLNQMSGFVEEILNGGWQGFAGDKISDVVNIGIGGSDLGPAMVYEALTPFQIAGIQCHFVSNVDPSHIRQTLAKLNPSTTLFVIASKTFTTLETMKNAEAAKRWILRAADESALAKHFVAVSANVPMAKEFGIKESSIFPLWDWVGGRYSLWSSIGLPLALGLGMSNFKALLNGAHAMDTHFRTAPLNENIPVLMALLNIWYLNFFKAESQAILPYTQNLHLFPAFLQQLDMESLGKSVCKDGSSVKTETGGIVWGSAGTNGQHSFHQLLHQGTHLIPADFIAIAKSPYQTKEDEEQHQHLLANCFAQSQALMQGKSLEETMEDLLESGLDEGEASRLAPHKVVAGNKPSSTIILETLNPETLGSLIACYEQKVFAQSVVLQINAFDQWGVQLGKVLSTDLYKVIADKNSTENIEAALDSSTQGLIDLIK